MSSGSHDFQGVNAAYIEELYERYLRDPHSVDASARTLFETWTPPRDAEPANLGTSELRNPGTALAPRLVIGAINLAQSIRRYGHLAAAIDPLGARRLGDPTLNLETHGVTES